MTSESVGSPFVPVATDGRARDIARVGATSGVLAVALWIAAAVLLDHNEATVLGDSDKASAAQVAAYLHDEATTIYLGTILFGIGTVAFLWFLATLRDGLARSAGGLATWAFASGVVAIATTSAFFAMRLGATMALDARPDGISDQAVEALYVGMDGFFVMTWFALGGFYLATGLASLRTGALPRWLSWTTVALGVVALVVWIAWIAEFLLPVWVAMVTACLVRQNARPLASSHVGA
jgi:hypothetical protein